jgi:hypothetical protein
MQDFCPRKVLVVALPATLALASLLHCEPFEGTNSGPIDAGLPREAGRDAFDVDDARASDAAFDAGAAWCEGGRIERLLSVTDGNQMDLVAQVSLGQAPPRSERGLLVATLVGAPQGFSVSRWSFPAEGKRFRVRLSFAPKAVRSDLVFVQLIAPASWAVQTMLGYREPSFTTVDVAPTFKVNAVLGANLSKTLRLRYELERNADAWDVSGHLSDGSDEVSFKRKLGRPEDAGASAADYGTLQFGPFCTRDAVGADSVCSSPGAQSVEYDDIIVERCND